MSKKKIILRQDIESFNRFISCILEGNKENIIIDELINYSYQIELAIEKLRTLHILTNDNVFKRPSFSFINIFYLEPENHEIEESINKKDNLKIFINILTQYLDKNDQVL